MIYGQLKPALLEDNDSHRGFIPIDEIDSNQCFDILAAFGSKLQQLMLDYSIERLSDHLSTRAMNCLRYNDVVTIKQFLEITEKVFLRFTHAGRKSWQEVYDLQRQLRGELEW